jgi:hypothetical protein
MQVKPLKFHHITYIVVQHYMFTIGEKVPSTCLIRSSVIPRAVLTAVVKRDISRFVGRSSVVYTESVKSTISWDITPCSPLKVNRRFGWTYRLNFQGRKISRLINQFERWWQAGLELMMEALQRTTRCYIPEDATLYNHRCENLKSYASLQMFSSPLLMFVVCSFLGVSLHFARHFQSNCLYISNASPMWLLLLINLMRLHLFLVQPSVFHNWSHQFHFSSWNSDLFFYF